MFWASAAVGESSSKMLKNIFQHFPCCSATDVLSSHINLSSWKSVHIKENAWPQFPQHFSLLQITVLMLYWGQRRGPAVGCINFSPFHNCIIFLFPDIQYFPNQKFIRNPYYSACDSIYWVSCSSGMNCIWFPLLRSLGDFFFPRSHYFKDPQFH